MELEMQSCKSNASMTAKQLEIISGDSDKLKSLSVELNRI